MGEPEAATGEFSSRPRRLGMGLLVAFAVPGLAYLVFAARLVAFPHTWENGEGVVLADALALYDGESPYRDLDEYPFLVANYPPVYTGLWALGMRVAGRGSWVPGRLMTVAAIFVIMLSTADIVYRETRWGGLAAAGGLCILSVGFISRIGPVARVDFVAAAASFLGVCVTHRQLGTRRWVWPVALFFLAAYTKHSAVAGAVASLVYLAFADRPKAVKSGGLLVAGGLPVVALLQMMTSGNFLRHVLSYTWTRLEWGLVWPYLRGVLRQGGWFFALSVVGLVATTRLRAQRAAPAPKGRGLIILYLASNGLSILQLAKVGSAYLYLVELAAVACLTFPLLINDVFVLTGNRTWRSRVAGTIIATLVTGHVVLGHRAISASFAQPSTVSHERLEMYFRIAEGPILAEDIGAVIGAGKPVMVNPFILSQLGARSRYVYSRGEGGRKRSLAPNKAVPEIAKAHDQVLADIVKGRFALIETGSLLDAGMYIHVPPKAWGMAYMITDQRFSPAWQDAIGEHYRLEHIVGIKGIYVPR